MPRQAFPGLAVVRPSWREGRAHSLPRVLDIASNERFEFPGQESNEVKSVCRDRDGPRVHHPFRSTCPPHDQAFSRAGLAASAAAPG